MTAGAILLGVWVAVVAVCAMLAGKAWRLTKPFEEIQTRQWGSCTRKNSRLHIWGPLSMAVLGGGLIPAFVREDGAFDLASGFVIFWLFGTVFMQAGWLAAVKRQRARRAETRS
ncbi:hypothetical protein [Caulobacter sp. DWR2-3-1b2]|uniref:hypothetical protein n=1 Tax=unclassified Caulobacter TaxID=2648921 RepID=UPI003CF1D3BF